MICTVTFNPSLDYIVSVGDFRTGRTNRTDSERILPGGKGINVSVVLKNLGIGSRALGFTAGFTGEEIRREVEALGICPDFISVPEGLSRINVKIRNLDGTEINGMGPVIGEDRTEELMEKLDGLGAGDVLVLAGSIPASLPDDMYSRILERLQSREILSLVDAEGDLLKNALRYHPFLIKPNHHELGGLFSAEIRTREEALPFAERLREMGARNVLVSLGGDGAVLAAEDGSVYMAPAPEGRLVNSVGAGDSMLAGFLAGWLEKRDYGHAFRMGLAAGSASAFSECLASGEEIRALYEQVASFRRRL